ncbi:DUF2683 family protein [Candidatus Woesearchaeota archaeon]|nr:DUF2683 family protein [Candidatus Woesearchaeota archaeon]
MVKVQVDLSDEENRIVEVYKALKSFVTKEETIKKIIQEFKNKLKL